MTQRLEDYWLGLRLQDMDIPAIHLVRADGVAHDVSASDYTSYDPPYAWA